MILVIDFGSQYNQLIARRVREAHVFCQIEPPSISMEAIRTLNPDGIILSGGPSSIYDENAPKIDGAVLDLNIPILGICYGMQFMVGALGASWNVPENGSTVLPNSGSKNRKAFSRTLIKKQNAG